jgi:hypothetical protein
MVRQPVEVVLAGGVFKTDDEQFFTKLEADIRSAIPKASITRLDVPPVAGAALHGLDLLGFASPAARSAARTRLRDALRAWRP